MSSAAADPYLDPVSGVLRNRLGITDAEELADLNALHSFHEEEGRTAGRRQPIYDSVVGNGDGEVPLKKLQRHMAKLPGSIDVKRMDTIDSRLSALSSRGTGPAMPKGPDSGRRQDP